ncbi:hypothetical protein [Nocardia aurantiaca]|uniref:DUF8176 domain-containing protein n=1 Tax=Nocardia aurantiaca TaxID=2675850 RepID=A0A6I3KUJ3_9NOCA|nr:hypothetical protein [Nocardia aurantiaca]MTE11734.1 hypothetical protein [Nocardia aurantiaca]
MVSGRDESADRQASEGKQPGSAGRQESEFGPSLNDFGPSLNDFGPSLNDFGPAPAADAPGWSPVAGPQSPDLAWRPAGTPVPPQYRAPDAWQPVTGRHPAVNGPSTGQFPAVEGAVRPPSTPDVEQTVKIPPGGAQSPAVDVGATTRIYDVESAADARNSTSAAQAAESGGAVDSWWRSEPSGFPPAPPSESAASQGESLSWADDPIVKALAPKTPVPQHKPEDEGPNRRRIGLIAAAAVAVLAVAGAAVFAVARGGRDDAPTAGATTTDKASPTAAALSCPARQEGKLTIGNGAGGTGSGVDAILGFQHAFYVDRSGVKARTFVAPEATTVQPADVIQTKGIDRLGPGTTYCLKIVEVAPRSYDVDITEHRADGTTEVYVEHITTVERDGKHLIMSIE